MSWAKSAIEALRRGETVRIRPRGHSMKGRVNDGDLVTVAPCDPATALAPGDVVLVRVRGTDYLHLVKAADGGRCLIGNNRGGVNGWVGPAAVYGKAIRVEPGHTPRRRDGGATADAAPPPHPNTRHQTPFRQWYEASLTFFAPSACARSYIAWLVILW